jgi:epoxide hydrolase 4
MELLQIATERSRFSARALGPANGPLVLLLHGFPQLALAWDRQLEALGAAGFRAVAPDLRGYGGSTRSGPYDLGTVVGDLESWVNALGASRAILVGHDWGGVLAWTAASLLPARTERLIVLNAPHPGAMLDALTGNPGQWLRSAYALFFQLPGLPEWLIARHHARGVARMLRGGSAVKDVWTADALEPYRAAFSTPGAVAAPLGYYRSFLRTGWAIRRATRANPIQTPIDILWGERERALGLDLISEHRLRPYLASGEGAVVRPRVHLLEGVGHFLMEEAPVRINRLLLACLGR